MRKQVPTPSLRVGTPKDRKLKFLQEQSLIAPEGITSDARRLQLDFTSLSSQTIGQIHSEFSARLSYGLYCAGKLAAEIGIYRYNYKLQSRLWRRKKADYETIKDLEAAMHEDEQVALLEREIVRLEAEQAVVQAVVQGYEVLTKAASREIARRESEKVQRG